MIQKLLDLVRLCLQLGRVHRATLHDDGVTPESDTDHTTMLGIVACAYANLYAPGMDKGLVAQFALIHDLVEARCGDTNTLGVFDPLEKAAREKVALKSIATDFDQVFPWVSSMIAMYERQSTPEARFVKIMDKILPCATHLLNQDACLKRAGLLTPKMLAHVESVHRHQEKVFEKMGDEQLAARSLLIKIHQAWSQTRGNKDGQT